MIKDVVVTDLDVIDTPGGNVMHAIKNTSNGFKGFGEAYFSCIDNGAIKAWKRHKNMTLNLIVPVGKVKFVLFDDRDQSNVQFQEIILSRHSYSRLTVPPMIWIGFKGLLENGSMLLNVANIEHNPYEVDRLEIDKINYDWSALR
tara:strand:- start:8374 stop:8808 length:435 start_codon:yes stop_codon:yes gene_type:complete